MLCSCWYLIAFVPAVQVVRRINEQNLILRLRQMEPKQQAAILRHRRTLLELGLIRP